jgi:hypothetical protein
MEETGRRKEGETGINREIYREREREKCRKSFSARISNRLIRCNTGILRALIRYLY